MNYTGERTSHRKDSTEKKNVLKKDKFRLNKKLVESSQSCGTDMEEEPNEAKRGLAAGNLSCVKKVTENMANANVHIYKLKKQITSLRNEKSGETEAPESVKKKLRIIYEEADREMKRSLGLIEDEEIESNETGHKMKMRDQKKCELFDTSIKADERIKNGNITDERMDSLQEEVQGVEDLRKELINTSMQKAKDKELLSTLKSCIKDKQKTINTLMEQLQNAKDDMQNFKEWLEPGMMKAKEQLEERKEQCEELKCENQRLKFLLRSSNEENTERTALKTTLEEPCDELEQVVRSANEQLHLKQIETGEANKEMESFGNDLLESKKQNIEIKESMDKVTMCLNLKKENDAIKRKRKDLVNKVEGMEKQVSEMSLNLKCEKDDIEALDNEPAELKNELRTAKQIRKELMADKSNKEMNRIVEMRRLDMKKHAQRCTTDQIEIRRLQECLNNLETETGRLVSENGKYLDVIRMQDEEIRALKTHSSENQQQLIDTLEKLRKAHERGELIEIENTKLAQLCLDVNENERSLKEQLDEKERVIERFVSDLTVEFQGREMLERETDGLHRITKERMGKGSQGVNGKNDLFEHLKVKVRHFRNEKCAIEANLATEQAVNQELKLKIAQQEKNELTLKERLAENLRIVESSNVDFANLQCTNQALEEKVEILREKLEVARKRLRVAENTVLAKEDEISRIGKKKSFEDRASDLERMIHNPEQNQGKNETWCKEASGNESELRKRYELRLHELEGEMNEAYEDANRESNGRHKLARENMKLKEQIEVLTSDVSKREQRYKKIQVLLRIEKEKVQELDGIIRLWERQSKVMTGPPEEAKKINDCYNEDLHGEIAHLKNYCQEQDLEMEGCEALLEIERQKNRKLSKDYEDQKTEYSLMEERLKSLQREFATKEDLLSKEKEAKTNITTEANNLKVKTKKLASFAKICFNEKASLKMMLEVSECESKRYKAQSMKLQSETMRLERHLEALEEEIKRLKSRINEMNMKKMEEMRTKIT